MAASYRSLKTEIRKSAKEGRGLFAKEMISKCEIISIRGGHIITKEIEPIIPKPPGYWGYPISDQHVLAPLTAEEVETVMMFLNHSCDPNVGILGQIIFVAMRDINKEEELTIDYAMFGAYNESMICNCQSDNCRGKITNFDWAIDALQTRYKGYFSSFIQLKIDALSTTNKSLIRKS